MMTGDRLQPSVADVPTRTLMDAKHAVVRARQSAMRASERTQALACTEAWGETFHLVCALPRDDLWSVIGEGRGTVLNSIGVHHRVALCWPDVELVEEREVLQP